MKIKLILCAIVGLGFILRFNQLEKNPPSLNLDEVAIGYNAYSILKTGRDEYGEKFPLAFRSHDDYKPPLYIYLTVPSVAVFGLNPFAVRFPSALLGTITVFLTFFLTQKIFSKSLTKKEAINIALISSLLLAISPWHLQVSRAAFEVNVAVFFIVLGVLTFIKGVRSNSKWWVVTALSFTFCLYTYQATRLFIPLLSILLLLIFTESIKKHISNTIIASLLFLISVLPLIPIMTSTAGQMRFKGTSVFEHPGLIQEEVNRAAIDAEKQNPLIAKIFHNIRIASFLTVTEGYLKHFSPDIIFLGRKGPLYNFTPNIGLLYLIELPFLVWGFIKLWNQKGKAKILLTGWVLLAPIASSLTWDIPSSTRITVMIPAIQIITAIGIHNLIQKISTLKLKAKYIYTSILITIFLINFGYYLHQYYIHAPIEYAEAWQYGYKEAVEYANQNREKYDRVIVSTNLKQPQNFFAFYTKYDPETYIFKDGGTVSGGFLETNNKFDKYEFHPIDYSNLNSYENILLIDLYEKIPGEFINNSLIKVINLPNGKPTIGILKI